MQAGPALRVFEVLYCKYLCPKNSSAAVAAKLVILFAKQTDSLQNTILDIEYSAFICQIDCC
ncbi:MAG: hypothetical protein ACI8RT_001245 [Candidatus Azotimanducaceae bacterium]|jgi:hypothetical protein|tara:strand:- start:487 stop:672 length:186 start_codon:yes stop_codon:yes gene_type:complete